MDDVIRKGHPEWDRLFRLWLRDHKPGWVVISGDQYRVLQTSDEDVAFAKVSGFDSMYGQTTQGMPK